MKAGILNITGYGGVELARILNRHTEFEITSVTGRSAAGENLSDIFPHLSGLNLTIKDQLDDDVDIVFSALPHAASAQKLKAHIDNGQKVIDFSADFRLDDPKEYESWYGTAHPLPNYLNTASYGLPELNRKSIKASSIVANPGCYPTASILALAPAMANSFITEDVIIDAKSGVSGAGRGLSLDTHFSELNESIKAYSVSGHRHMPEVIQEINKLNNDLKIKLTFMTHLIPITRGILVSVYAGINPLKLEGRSNNIDLIRAIYQEYYKNEKFVTVTNQPPTTKQTLGTNQCLIYPTIDTRNNRLIVIACIDNLVKGAAGQAVQNANILFGFPEETGLEELALYP
ncbi:MAG: N-acetyl-gamma-glutamyl-phosphate reductase [Chloroflexi bacterium]|jgi:N-acetyl-gamma-glutamyl-phosphate reductase|nr:MAG: N-acetyl-gamma-glutamyl-phosphate reductase [Chloroflexota bacterium]